LILLKQQASNVLKPTSSVNTEALGQVRTTAILICKVPKGASTKDLVNAWRAAGEKLKNNLNLRRLLNVTINTNTNAFIESQQYSQFILENLHDYLLPEGMWRDVTDFGSGTTLNIKTVGTVTIQDAAEDTPLTFHLLTQVLLTLSITDYVGDAWKVSDDLREDGSQVDTLMAMRAMESTRALGENHETTIS
jgi:hypothetical protein